jgi:hypothetical protein
MRPAIHLHTFDSDMAVAWGQAFKSDDRIQIIEGDILVGTADAVVSPANSFGYMDGGIDLAYRNFFGMKVQHRVRGKIHADHFGELPVGQAVIVETDHPLLPFLIVAPTMRVPDRIGDTVYSIDVDDLHLSFGAIDGRCGLVPISQIPSRLLS